MDAVPTVVARDKSIQIGFPTVNPVIIPDLEKKFWSEPLKIASEAPIAAPERAVP